MKDSNKMSAWERLKAPIPKFFRSLSWIGGFIIAFTTPMLISGTKHFNTMLWLNGIGASMVAVSKFTVKTELETKEGIKEDIASLKIIKDIKI